MGSPERQDSPPSLPPGAPAQHDPRTSDHLANERTYLAWVRTSIAVIGLGFVVAKFSVWLRQLAARIDEPVRAAHSGWSLPLGLAMMALGGFLSTVAAWRYRRVRQAIDRGEPAADERTIKIVTVMVLVITATLVVYMLEAG